MTDIMTDSELRRAFLTRTIAIWAFGLLLFGLALTGNAGLARIPLGLIIVLGIAQGKQTQAIMESLRGVSLREQSRRFGAPWNLMWVGLVVVLAAVPVVIGASTNP